MTQAHHFRAAQWRHLDTFAAILSALVDPYLTTLKPDEALPLVIVADPDRRILRRGPVPPDLQSAMKAITQ